MPLPPERGVDAVNPQQGGSLDLEKQDKEGNEGNEEEIWRKEEV